MKKFEINLDYGLSETDRKVVGVDLNDKQLTRFLVEQCFHAIYNNQAKGGMGSDHGVQYRSIRQAMDSAVENGDSSVKLAASDFNFLKKTVENCKLATGLAFIKPVLQESLSNAVDENMSFGEPLQLDVS